MAKKKAAKQDLSAEAQLVRHSPQGDGGRAKAEGPSFEARLGRVEEIVERLESGEAGLDESLRLYAEGAELIKACRATLAEAEKRIAKLSEKAGGPGPNGAGAPGEEPFEPEESEAEQ
jgi:exodeoxyribonuclease VII small subunit